MQQPVLSEPDWIAGGMEMAISTVQSLENRLLYPKILFSCWMMACDTRCMSRLDGNVAFSQNTSF